jgi:hypothetical protein
MSAVLDREAIDKFVIDTLVDLGVDRAQVTKESSLDHLCVDSLDIVRCVWCFGYRVSSSKVVPRMLRFRWVCSAQTASSPLQVPVSS